MKKTAPVVGILAVLIALTLLIPLANTVPWSGETQLTDESNWDGFASVTQAGDGKIWVVWTSDRGGLPGTNYEIFQKVYNGTNWTDDAPLITNPTANDVSPAILQASNGTLWLFWISDDRGNYEIYYKTSANYGDSWSDEVRLTRNSADDFGLSVCEATDGTIWVVWYREFPETYNVFCKKYTISNLSWSSDTQLTIEIAPDKLPSVAQLHDGKICVVWQTYREDNMDLYYKMSSDNGASWSSDTRLTSHSDLDTDPAIYRTLYGTAWIVYSRRPPTPTGYNDLYYVTSSDDGASWSDPIECTTDKYDDVYPGVTQSLDRKIWIVWASNRVGQPDGNLELFYKTTIPLEGDVNGDWTVNIYDLALVGKSYKKRVGDPGYNLGADLNNDGIVDIFDLYFVARNYGSSA